MSSIIEMSDKKMSKLFNSLIEVQSFLNIVVQISGERNTIDPSESIHLSDEEYIKQWDARHTIKEVYKIPDSDEDFKILMDQHWSRYPDKDKSIDHNFYYFIKSEIEHANRILANLLDATGASKNPSVPRVKEILEFEIRLEQYKDFLRNYILVHFPRRIENINELLSLANQKRSVVVCYGGKQLYAKPAAFLIGWPLKTLSKYEFYLYTNTKKQNHLPINQTK